MSDDKYNALLEEFVYFVAEELFNEEWDFNSTHSFPELACRKLAKLGIVEVREKEYVYPNMRTEKEE